jgi:hypothetical protein
MEYENVIKDNKIIVFANTTLFNKDAVFKCVYWFGDKFHTTISFEDENTFKIVI